MEGVPSEPGAADSLSVACSDPRLPFLAGVTVPLLVLAAPYLATGSLGDLYTGLFVTPRGRLESGYYATAAPAAVVFAIPVLVVLLALRRRTRTARNTDVAASVALGVLLLLSTVTLVGYLTMWYTTTSLLPVGVIVGVAVLARDADPGVRVRQTPVFLLLSLSAFIGLVQFPFGAPVYFCFVAPLGGARLARDVPAHAPPRVVGPRLSVDAPRVDRRLRIRRQPQRPLPGRNAPERRIRRR